MIAWIPAIPLFGFLINGLAYLFSIKAKHHHHDGHDHHGHDHGHHHPSILPGILATLALLASFILTVQAFLHLQTLPADARFLEVSFFPWMEVSHLKISWALRMDSLSSLFCLVITGVGTLIHLYSVGYMSHDESPGKFFCYLNLFCFAMLMLVLGSSLPILFLGWEGVGLCSYLLIGYWYTDIEKAKAGKKAFVANRVGDLGFLIGMFLIFSSFGTLDFSKLSVFFAQQNLLSSLPAGVLTAMTLALFLGCTGKSAQIPLYVWLPDAMAGPTPVSALIHAATMVTSGIYLVARLNPLFSASPTAMNVVAIIGVLTALLAATIAVVQTDIKKVLAYSTVSQLGYMFLACGVGAYTAGVFHVITHAFFKALMFLGAGSVIHGMHEEQDILKMGGLRKKMPVTFITFAVGWLAISGIPGFSGFFSKDEILWNSFASPYGNKVLWVLASLTAAMTAFYMTRMVYLTFMGTTRASPQTFEKVHESPATMTIPLIVLAIFSAVGGLIGIPAIIRPHSNWLEHWLEPIIQPIPHEAFTAGHTAELSLMLGSSLLAILAIAFAWKSYAQPGVAEKRKASFSSLHKTLFDKWYIDEIYENTFIQPIHSVSNKIWKWFDIAFIDRIVVGFGKVSMWGGHTFRLIQNGSIQAYLLMVLLGLAFGVGYLIYGLI